MGSHGSDHLPCTVSVRKGPSSQATKRARAFKYSLKEADVVTKLQRTVCGSVKAKRKSFSQPPWWNNDVEKLWCAKRTAWRAAQRSRHDTTLQQRAKQAAQEFKEGARTAKRDKWTMFCHEVSSDRALHKFWRLHRAMNRQQTTTSIPDFTTENNKWAKTDAEKGEALFQRYLQQTDQRNEAERLDILNGLRTQFGDCLPAIAITPEMLEAALKRSADTAPGPDGVRYSHMGTLEPRDMAELAERLDSSLKEGAIPEDWLHSHLAPIPKPGKDHSKIAGYRIITMQNTVGKLLEGIVARHISSQLETQKLLPSTLGSYRPRKDTWMNASVLAADVYEGFERGYETLVAALDLEDAYNRVPFEIIMRTLANMDIDPAITIWTGVALLKRTVSLRVGAWASQPTAITPGLPQGSALSPVLFNVYTIGITSNQLEGPGRTLSFADDVLVYRQGKDRQAVADSMQLELNRIDEWCSRANGRIHPEKACVLWCTLNNRAVQATMPQVFIGGKGLERTSALKYLGITFDRTLSTKEHINNVIIIARKELAALKTMAAAFMPSGSCSCCTTA